MKTHLKTSTTTLAIAAAASLVLSVGVSAQASARRSLDHEAIAARIAASLAVQPGERVLLVSHPQFGRELIRPLRLEIVRRGGVDMGVVEVLSEPFPPAMDGTSVQASEAAARETYRKMFTEIDAAVMLPGATSNHSAYAAMQDLLNQGHGRVIHFHWDVNGSVVPIPGQPIPPAHEVDRVYADAVVDTDYEALGATQQAFVAAMRAGEVHVTTPAGTDIRFRIGNRPVNVQDGDASASRAARGRILIDREIELPAGVIRVAPLEESVQGRIVFPLSNWGGLPVRDLTLVIRDGRVVDVQAEHGVEGVRAELEEAGSDASRFREFALGFNPLLAVPDRNPWIPYYGYGAGVVRLSLGDNSELGGVVGGGYVRWNFFEDASVRVDDEVWVEDGRLIGPEHP